MRTNNILAIIGLILDMMGIVIMYYNTPSFNSTMGDYGMPDENGVVPKKSFIKQFEAKHGLILVFIGFVLQLLNYLINFK